MFCRYFKYELKAKGTIAKVDLLSILSFCLDYSSGYCMYTPNQLCIYTIAHLSGGWWYIDYSISYIHPLEVQLWKSLEGTGTIDMEVDKFARLTSI